MKLKLLSKLMSNFLPQGTQSYALRRQARFILVSRLSEVRNWGWNDHSILSMDKVETRNFKLGILNIVWWSWCPSWCRNVNRKEHKVMRYGHKRDSSLYPDWAKSGIEVETINSILVRKNLEAREMKPSFSPPPFSFLEVPRKIWCRH